MTTELVVTSPTPLRPFDIESFVGAHNHNNPGKGNTFD